MPEVTDEELEAVAQAVFVQVEANLAMIAPGHRCGGHNAQTWYCPNEIWNQIMRASDDLDGKYAGIICPSCLNLIARGKGIEVVWSFAPETHDERMELRQRVHELTEELREALEGWKG